MLRGMTARTLTLLLGLWLFVSAFIWPRAPASAANAGAVGLVACIAAVAAMWRRRARFLDTALSAWLLASAFLLPQRSGVAFWNDVTVAFAMLALSLVPGTMYPLGRRAAPAA